MALLTKNAMCVDRFYFDVVYCTTFSIVHVCREIYVVHISLTSDDSISIEKVTSDDSIRANTAKRAPNMPTHHHHVRVVRSTRLHGFHSVGNSNQPVPVPVQ